MIETIRIDEKIKELEGKYWQPKDIVEINNQVIRLALFKGEYHWHKHTKEDELFLVYKGSITIKIKGKEEIKVKAGEMIVIPKGIEHCPMSEEGAAVLLFEPQTLTSKGD
ncbi:MAG TPA: cupin domain-containing protein [Candidatus Bathyarchaeia archaeon]|nr:cupin domain-containing protein [Candidatus Bathyarchaeia archaeon]